MRPTGFLGRLYLGYVALILVTAMVTGAVVSRRVTQSSRHELQSSLRTSAVMLRELARPYLAEGRRGHSMGLLELKDRVDSLGHETATRLTVILPDGSVAADSREDPAKMENHLGRPEIEEARLTGWGRSERYSRTIGHRMVYVAAVVREGDALLGYVRTAVPSSQVSGRFAQLRGSILLGSLVGGLVAALLGLLLARRIAHPLKTMTVAVESMAEGNYDQRIHVRSSQEVATLAAAFNSMAARIRQHVDVIAADQNRTLAILGAMKEGVVAVDVNEAVVHLNEAAGRMFGLKPESALGRRMWEIMRLPELNDALNATLERLEGQSGEVRIVGERLDQVMELQTSVLRDRQNAVTGAVLVLHDVTQLRRLEEVRRDFVTNVSHELKTPLAAMRGLVETVVEDPDMDPELRRGFLNRVQNQLNRLSDLVGDLLSLARAETPRARFERRPLDLRGPLVDSIEDQMDVAGDKGLRLESELASAPVRVVADAEALRQIFDNLLSNAVRYTPSGGRIQVRLRREERWAVVEVRDTGIGVDPMQQERIFERFYRVDKGRSRDAGGTGLGLAIVKHVVKTLGGRVELESALGAGSTFRVTLPCAPDELPPV